MVLSHGHVPSPPDLAGRDVYAKSDANGYLRGVAESNMLGTLKQLEMLGQMAASIFAGVQTRLVETTRRQQDLGARLTGLQAKVVDFEKHVLDADAADLYCVQSTEWHAPVEALTLSELALKPDPLVEARCNAAAPPPPLDHLDRFNDPPGSCMAKYSDPDFFLRSWMEKVAENEKKRKERREKRKGKKKARENSQSVAKGKKVQAVKKKFVPVHDELMGSESLSKLGRGTSAAQGVLYRTPRGAPDGDPYAGAHTPATVPMADPDDDDIHHQHHQPEQADEVGEMAPQGDSPLVPAVAGARRSTIPHAANQGAVEESDDEDGPMAASHPAPPAPPPPPSPFGAGQGVGAPPPPAAPGAPPPPAAPGAPPPPPAPGAPPPPPAPGAPPPPPPGLTAPALNAPSQMKTRRSLKSVQQKPRVVSARDEMLSQIRTGKMLRKVSQKPPVAAKPSAAGNPMAEALKRTFVAVHGESSEEESSDNEDDWDE